MAKERGIDKKWRGIFKFYNIPEKVEEFGFYDITATQINDFEGKEEARVMCKFDFEEKIALPFRESKLSILATKNGQYRIAATRPFLDVSLDQAGAVKPILINLPYLETLEADNITNESKALDAALASGMISDLIGESQHLTVRGRRYSTKFDLEIANVNNSKIVTYPISSVQFEVDGGYEGETKLALIEAKMGSANNMNLRQLLYPHMHFEKTIEKEVQSFVLFYEIGGIFTFIPMLYEAGIASFDYSGIKRYKLVQGRRKNQLCNIPSDAINYDAPSPQADDFNKVLFGLNKLFEDQPLSKDELFAELPISFHNRQYDYYFNALKWLGLAKNTSGTCRLTPFGEAVMEISESSRIQVLRKVFLQDSIFQGLLSDKNYSPSNAEKARWKVNHTTWKRRRSTALSWLRATDGEQQANLT